MEVADRRQSPAKAVTRAEYGHTLMNRGKVWCEAVEEYETMMALVRKLADVLATTAKRLRVRAIQGRCPLRLDDLEPLGVTEMYVASVFED